MRAHKQVPEKAQNLQNQKHIMMSRILTVGTHKINLNVEIKAAEHILVFINPYAHYIH